MSTGPDGENRRVGDDGERSSDNAVPSVLARALALVAILAAGLCGGLIGYGITDIQTDGDGGTAAAIGGIVGALAASIGVAIVAVLALRAMSEWRTIEERRARTSPDAT